MATRKKTTKKQPAEPRSEQVSFTVEPGKKVRITIEVGEKVVRGKVPLKVQLEEVPEEQPAAEEKTPVITEAVQPPILVDTQPQTESTAPWYRFKVRELATWLFILAISVYLVTRLVGLSRFPIYFFTDEAIQSQSMADLIRNEYDDPTGTPFPTYFRNGEYYNIGVSVYAQWLPVLLFGKSAVATRVMSVLITLLAAFAVGLILRDVFKIKYWWIGTLLLSITPAWFLHSRTAFETAEFVAFYAGALWAYLNYRYRSPRFLYPAVLLGAIAFYTYSPGQLLVPLTAIGFVLSDWRYHWENRRTVLASLGLVVLVALPYLRFRLGYPNAPFAHLRTLFSYWTENIPLQLKITRYISEYWIGLSPWYWYIPNDRDLPRHLMKDYGHIMIATLPFLVLGAVHVLRNLRQSAYRAILICVLVSPTAAALVQASITRLLLFVIPAAIVTALGFEQVFDWIQNPAQRIRDLRAGPPITPLRIVAALSILGVGIIVAAICKEPIDRVVPLVLAALLALDISGLLARLSRSLTNDDGSVKWKLWKVREAWIAISAAVILSGVNVYMLNDALTNGPLWFRDYGLGGMQYGAFQIFDILKSYVREHPDTKIIFSPDWANGADTVARFFLEPHTPIQVGSVRGHISAKLPLDDNILFVMIPEEFRLVTGSGKFKDIRVETIIPYPDGSPGFYFVHLRYVDNIDEVFAAEKAARQVLQEDTFTIDGQAVKVRFPYLDSDFQKESMALVFDNDPFTVAKTYETNPFVMQLTFPERRKLTGFSIIIGSAHVRITMQCIADEGASPVIYTFEGQGAFNSPELSFDFPEPADVKVLGVEVLSIDAASDSKVHIWELKLR